MKARRKTRCQYTAGLLQPIPESANPPGAHLEANKGDLHGEDGSQAVDCAIGYVDPVGEAPGEHQHQDVQGDEVDQEDVAAPRGDLPGHKADTHPQVPGLNSCTAEVKHRNLAFLGSQAGFSPGSNTSWDLLYLRASCTSQLPETRIFQHY